jgi:hypothetical protein
VKLGITKEYLVASTSWCLAISKASWSPVAKRNGFVSDGGASFSNVGMILSSNCSSGTNLDRYRHDLTLPSSAGAATTTPRPALPSERAALNELTEALRINASIDVG